jgi:hypothetical protein
MNVMNSKCDGEMVRRRSSMESVRHEKTPRKGRVATSLVGLAFGFGWCRMPNNPRIHLFLAEIVSASVN